MQIAEIVGKLTDVNQDTNLPQRENGEIDTNYVNKMWPGLISGITNYLIDSDGKRNYANLKELQAQGFSCFAINRNSDPSKPCGRVMTDKGLIMIY